MNRALRPGILRDKIRLLMGDEVSLRTKRAFSEGLRQINTRLDGSIESEKTKNDFLEGVPAIVEALRSGKVECRVYRRDKFHAKAYITHGRSAVVGSFGLVGSSNFTYPGLSDNVELNVQIRGPEVGILQDWYERHWEDAEDVTPDILRTLERHISPHPPFIIWAKALHEYFYGRALSPDEWDEQKSIIWPLLARYQRDAYKNLVGIATRFGGAFLCDGVGLGNNLRRPHAHRAVRPLREQAGRALRSQSRPGGRLGDCRRKTPAGAEQRFRQPCDLQPHRPPA